MKTLSRIILVWMAITSSSVFANQHFTKHPIVMVGGATAFDTFDLGFVSIDYWYGITDTLRGMGAEVYVTNLSGVQSNEVRAEELLNDIEAILDLSGAEKVNLIAHSQGALASRYAAAVMPDQVASVFTVTGMNRGTHVSPWTRATVEELGVTSGGVVETLLEVVAGLVMTFGWEGLSTDGQDGEYNSPQRGWQSLLALEEATNPAFVQDFNDDFPAGLPSQNCMNDAYNGQRGDAAVSNNKVVNGIHYYSVGGNSNASFTGFFEVFDPVYWLITGSLNLLVVPNFDPNYQWDGLVPQCGHKLGHYYKTYFMSHFDAIGHFAGIRPSFVNGIYRKHAEELRDEGL